ncbi:uncharacterized protein TNCV_463991 [Trichonephila clavipes]|nr:uncharacterized protein TNCV_463991 [Trichonephila clavipes]
MDENCRQYAGTNPLCTHLHGDPANYRLEMQICRFRINFFSRGGKRTLWVYSDCGDNLELSIKKFWEIENVEIDSIKTSELDIWEDHFKNTHSRDDQGRYTVAMPLREDPSCLGEPNQTPIQRLNSLWKRLSGDKEYLSLYEKFSQKYEDWGPMREIKADRSGSTPWCLSPRKVYN